MKYYFSLVITVFFSTKVCGFFYEKDEMEVLSQCCEKNGSKDCKDLIFLSEQYYNAVTCSFESIGYLVRDSIDWDAVKNSITADPRYELLQPDDQTIVMDDCLRTGEENARVATLLVFSCVNKVMGHDIDILYNLLS